MGRIYARHPRGPLGPPHETSIWATSATVYDDTILRMVSLLHDKPDDDWTRELYPDNIPDICSSLGADKSLPFQSRCAYIALLQTYLTWAPGAVLFDAVPVLLSNRAFESMTELLEGSKGSLLKYFEVNGPVLGKMTFQERVALLWAQMLAEELSPQLCEEATKQVVESRAITAIGEWSLNCSAEQSRSTGNLVSSGACTVSNSRTLIPGPLAIFLLTLYHLKPTSYQVDMGCQIAGVRHKAEQKSSTSSPLWDEALTSFKELLGPSTPRCHVCSKPWSDDGAQLTRCSKCHARSYCTRACQVKCVKSSTDPWAKMPNMSDPSDWRVHRKECLELSASVS